MHPIIVWLQQDLRIYDNPALFFAAAKKQPIIVLFILDDEHPGKWKLGSAQRWWLHHSLTKLIQRLKVLGIDLILRRGDPLTIIESLVKQTEAAGVYWNRRYEPFHIKRDSIIKSSLKAKGVEAKSFNSRLLFEPTNIANKAGGFFKVFTPFWKTCRQSTPPPLPLSEPVLIPYPNSLASDLLESWQLLPVVPDWAHGLRETWQPGELGAQLRWQAFLKGALDNYAHQRDYPGEKGTSELSPHLHFGEISVNQLWHDCQKLVAASTTIISPNTDKFLAELGWREFSYHLLYHCPHIPEDPFRPEFTGFPWTTDRQALKRWQQGKTGYPIVDAGMKELWHTGIMHNRVRMIVASFLTKDLLISWQEGAQWFWDTLVDADLASNSANWQWVAGCGADAAPYFRIFNPELQGERFDPNGHYIRRWLPELTKLSDTYIHAPWKCPIDVRAACKVVLGKNYPLPIVEHDQARKRALAAYQKLSSKLAPEEDSD